MFALIIAVGYQTAVIAGQDSDTVRQSRQERVTVQNNASDEIEEQVAVEFNRPVLRMTLRLLLGYCSIPKVIPQKNHHWKRSNQTSNVTVAQQIE